MNRIDAARLHAIANQLLVAAGLPQPRAAVVASTLAEAELLGRSTHGLRLLDWYLADIARGAMARDASLIVASDHGSALVWDGDMLPGAWLVHAAIDEAFSRLEQHPVVTVAIRRSHHVGCHAVYLRRATARGVLMLLTDTNVATRVVAPFGGVEPLYSPTPISVGVPTDEAAIIIDFSLSSVSLSQVTLHHQRRARLAGKWLLDRSGKPTDDPSVIFSEPPGSILPLGGVDLGYKGFGLALAVYALSVGLSGRMPTDVSDGSESTVFVQVMDPDQFAGRHALAAAMSSFVAMCRRSAAAPGNAGVHIPGEALDETRRHALENGVELSAECVDMLREWSRRLAVPFGLD